jgi:polo-like kinase 1
MRGIASVPSRVLRLREYGRPSTYALGKLLGCGGFGTVYEVRDLAVGTQFALKVVPLASLTNPDLRAQIDEEINIQQSFDHPNILKLYDHFEDDFNLYLVLELCPHASVKKLLANRTYLSEAESANVLCQVLDALLYCHQQLVVHRDLKLDNFLIGHDGRIKVADFGISRRLQSEGERRHSVCGTIGYISPEMLSHSANGHNFAVDIWALGVCAFTLLAGRPPFEMRNHDLAECIKLPAYNFPRDRNLSFIAKDFVQSCLQTNPESRPTAKSLALHPFMGLGRKAHSALIAMLGISIEEPKCDLVDIPLTAVLKYCDQGDKLGLGYLLLNGTIGAVFRDGSRMVMDPRREFLQYWAQNGSTKPEIMELERSSGLEKVAILLKFSRAFKSTDACIPTQSCARDVPMVHAKSWIRGPGGILFRMSDNNVQLNFPDKQKLILLEQEKRAMLLQNFTDKVPAVPFASIQDHSAIGAKFGVAKEMIRELKGQARKSNPEFHAEQQK